MLATIIALLLAAAGSVTAQAGARDLGLRRAVLWTPYLSWQLPYPDAPDNPFDIQATVVFTHPTSGETHTSQLFYAGNDQWEFRFTGTRTGTWRFTTNSDHAPLSNWHGTIDVTPNPNDEAGGFLTTSDGRFAQRRGPDGNLEARLYNVNFDTTAGSHLHDFPLDPEARATAIAELLDQVQQTGMDAAFLSVSHGWLQYGALSYTSHDSDTPSLTSFDVLESILLAAHQRGLSVHIWLWGDEEGQRTPVGIGGINGPTDRRLQRYIAARLGPLPGWTMSYGYDLDEWVTPEQARSWWNYMHDHLGWPHLLMARETDSRAPRLLFDLGDEKLDVASLDDAPTEAFFDLAQSRLHDTAQPVLFERRFLHTRDDVWDMDTTRQALWQFTLAGGAGAIWGTFFDEGPPYPEPAQLQTHQRFWQERFSFELNQSSRLEGHDNAFILRDQDGRRTIIYAEATTTVPIEWTDPSTPLPAIAIDTQAPYQEINLGTLDTTNTTWTAPYPSDWAVALGTF